ncbi:MAG: hypothetical protein HZB59_08490 [Ignavibacteriales bacterium]|nr:hypothetical protein [Ignavibacteriales bacterium]
MKKIIFIISIIIVFISIVSDQASAIPAYARKYDMSCNVCHSPIPKLKPYGDEFAANGYQLKDKEPPRFARETGDDKLLLMRELPIAIRFDGAFRMRPGKDSVNAKTDIEWPFVMKILSSGQIAKDVSYFFYFLMNEKGSLVGVEDAFLYFNNVGNIDFDIMAGQYQVCDPVFKRELRPMYEDYEIYKAKPGMSMVDLTYDRGLMLSYTLPTETDIIASVSNGNGIEAGEDFMFDTDPYKNLFFRVAQPIDSNFSIGTLGYIGKEKIDLLKNGIGMAGVDATLSYDQLELCGQFMYREDSNPYFKEENQKIVTRGGFAQLMFAPELDKSDWYVFLMYNRIDSGQEDLKYHAVAGNFTYMLARNLKLLGEFGYDLERKQPKLTFGFMTAF